MKIENEFFGFIENLLHEHDCIIIPNFGGFVIKSHEFQYNEELQIIIPQKRSVAFNEKLKNDDGLLINEYATYHKITNKKAIQAINEFVDLLKSSIQQQSILTFGSLGDFSLSEEKKLQFMPNPNSNFNFDMFGLKEVGIAKQTKSPNLHLIPTNEVIAKDTHTIEDTFIVHSRGHLTKHKGIKNSVYAILFFIVAAVSTFILTEPEVHLFSSSLSPIPEISDSENFNSTKDLPNISSPNKSSVEPIEKANPEVQKPSEVVINEAAEIDQKNTIELIVGSFLTEKKAKQGIDELMSKGIEDAYIVPKKESEKYYRISLGNAKTLEEGYQLANQIKKQKKLDIWVFENNK